MRGLLTFAVAVVFGLSIALAQDPPHDEDEAPPPLAWNAFEKARAGGWCVFVVSHARPELTKQESLVFRVAAKGDGLVFERGDASGPLDVRATPTLPGYLETVLGFMLRHLEGVKTDDDPVTIAGKKLACKRTRFTTESRRDGRRVPHALWLSRDVEPANLVRYESDGLTVELAGFGSKPDELRWGKRVAEVKAALDEKR